MKTSKPHTTKPKTPPKKRIPNELESINAYFAQQKATVPHEIEEASAYITSTLSLCWSSAQTVFAKQATPADAIAIYRLLQERVQAQYKLDVSKVKAANMIALAKH